MRRRSYIAAVGLAATGGLAGCAGDQGSGSDSGSGAADGAATETAAEDHGDGHDGESKHEDSPDRVYVPDHATAMTMEGMGRDGDFRFSAMLSAPEVFYFVEGTDVTPSELLDGHNVHVMASVWDPETGTVLPETGLSVEVRTADGETVTQEVIYPMLSQRMGFHYGSNVALPETGEYTVSVSVGGMQIERTRAFDGRFGDPASVDIPVSFTEETRQEFTEFTPQDAGEAAALSPMEMGSRPTGALPVAAEMPGSQLTATTSDDAVLLSGVVSGTELGGDQPYLYVSPRTPYNRFPLPSMSIQATVEGADTEGGRRLTRRLDPGLGYHYGAALPEAAAQSLLAGKTGVEIAPSLPPQVTRHAGYETAFIDMEPVIHQRS